MLNISQETSLGSGEVIEFAREFFEKENGLNTADAGEDFAPFEGGGGGLTIAITTDAASGRNTVQIVTREWENLVREFLGQLSKKRPS